MVEIPGKGTEGDGTPLLPTIGDGTKTLATSSVVKVILLLVFYTPNHLLPQICTCCCHSYRRINHVVVWFWNTFSHVNLLEAYFHGL